MRITVEDASGGRVVIDGDDLEKAAAETEPWDGETIAGALVKSEDERRFTLCVAYPADKADVAVAADHHRDFVGKAALEEAAWSYLLKSREVGLHHQDGTAGAGVVVESYLWRADPWVVKNASGGEYTVHPGDWLVGIQWDESTWPLIKQGRIKGVSMQGTAERRRPAAEALANLRS